MKKLLKLYKEIGETPLECIKRWKAANPEYKKVPMTYAGRLDPMAEGILLILVGDECKQKEKYLGLDKEYIVEILFGFATDTYDILGKITKQGDPTSTSLWRSGHHKDLQSFVGKFSQKYPKYSSRNIKKVLFSTMVENSTFSDEVLTKEVEIYSVKFLGQRCMRAKKLLSDTKKRISKVKPARPDDSGRSGGGDFRQKAILSLWRKNLKNKNDKYQIVKIKVACSSGTYMRSLAHNLGKKIGIPALAFSIKRTKIGEHKI